MKYTTIRDWLVIFFWIAFAVAISVSITLAVKDYCDLKDAQQSESKIDNVRCACSHCHPRHDPREDSLKTLEDSIHFYEDGM